jgi:hypothetical protein
MATSEMRAVLFTKENCAPCLNTKIYIQETYYKEDAPYEGSLLPDNLVIMRQEDHPALVSAFHIDKFPTLIVTKGPDELDRVVGGVNIRGNLHYWLNHIANFNFLNQE